MGAPLALFPLPPARPGRFLGRGNSHGGNGLKMKTFEPRSGADLGGNLGRKRPLLPEGMGAYKSCVAAAKGTSDGVPAPPRVPAHPKRPRCLWGIHPHLPQLADLLQVALLEDGGVGHGEVGVDGGDIHEVCKKQERSGASRALSSFCSSPCSLGDNFCSGALLPNKNWPGRGAKSPVGRAHTIIEAVSCQNQTLAAAVPKTSAGKKLWREGQGREGQGRASLWGWSWVRSRRMVRKDGRSLGA